MMDAFEIQMNFVRERNRIKYENKLMKEEDLISEKSQAIFMQQRQMELKEKEMQLEQIIIQEQLENERKELQLFISNYIITRLNKNSQLNINQLTNEAENLFYERLLKRQQDYEYEKAIQRDSRK